MLIPNKTLSPVWLRLALNPLPTFLSYNQLDALISQIYFRNKTLHVSDSSSVHHQEFITAHTAMVHVIQVG